MNRFANFAAVISLLAGVFVSIINPEPAIAANAGNWNAGRIMDDAIFNNKSSMSVTEIQSFLNSKVPVCDTNHPAGASNQGAQPPWTCLKDYYENTSTKANNLNGQPVPAGAISAAQIIYNVAQQFNINPQVLLVTLQKENGLITDTWPYPWQFRTAMGFACPDTAACNPEYFGFYQQVYQGARHFRNFADQNSSWFIPYRIGTRNIQYNPNAGCGSGSVNVVNGATSALYSYTPYQPNASALGNLYGTGDSCGAYGNRNFWRDFTDWFGSTIDGVPTSFSLRVVSAFTPSPTNAIAGQNQTITFTVQNFGDQTISYQNVVLQCRINGPHNCDPTLQPGGSIAAGAQKTFSITLPTVQGGNYTLTPYFLLDGSWVRFGNNGATSNTHSLHIPDVRVISAVASAPSNPSAGQTATLKYTVQNFSSQPTYFQSSILQCRLNTSINCDPAGDPSGVIASGAVRTFTTSFSLAQGGSYVFTPYFLTNDKWYNFGGASSPLTLSVPDVRIVSAITPSPANPIPGQPVTVTYTVQNFGTQAINYQASILQCRVNDINCDSTAGGAITINAGAQRTFTENLSAVRAGTYALVPYFFTNGQWYRYGVSGSNTNAIQLVVPAYVADVRIVGAITTSPASPIPGQAFTVNFTVQNFGDKPAILQTSVLQCRVAGINCDPTYDGPFTIDSGAQRAFTYNFTARAGTYTFVPYFLQNDAWHRYGGTNSAQLVAPAYVADLRVVGNINTTPTQPIAGQGWNVSFTIQNFGDKPAILQASVLQCRLNISINCDPSYDGPITINPGDQRVMTYSLGTAARGTHRLIPYFMQNNTWYRYGSSQLTVTVP